LLPAAAGCLVALAMMNAVSDVAAWDRYSRDEQALVVEVVRRLPAVRSDTFIAIVEGRNARFEHKYYVWFYQNALRLVYGDRSIHVTLCFRDVRPRERERPSCEFREDGVHVRNPIGLAQAVWSYDRTILLARRPGGRMEVLTRVPGLSSPPPDYAPQALFDDVVPPPDRLRSYLKYAPALIGSQPL
jgi:hypothetical protein